MGGAVFVNHGAVCLDPEGRAVGMVLEFADRGGREIEGSVRLMGGTELGSELDGAPTAPGHGSTRHKRHTIERLSVCVVELNVKRVVCRKDALDKFFFRDLEGFRNVSHKAFALGQEDGFKGLP
jgi:hypothetical protein